MIDKSKTIKKYLKITGKSVSLVRADGSTQQWRAVIEQSWRRNKSHFESIATKIGRAYNDFYFYYGPYDVDITVLTNDDVIVCGDDSYIFVKSERVVVGDRVQCYTGVLKKIMGDEEYVFG